MKQNKPKTEYTTVRLNVWPYRRPDGRVTIKVSDQDFITTVNNQPGTKRHHKKLFAHLEKLLKSKNRWLPDD